jgi:hypothetical protein
MDAWKIKNDPGAWGARNPRFIVLGFSKGATQADIYADGPFDDVAFGGSQTRKNLTLILRSVGLLSPQEEVNDRIRAQESEFHFGSLVRCSLARLNEGKSRAKARSVYETSGALILKSFLEVPEVIRGCTSKYLSELPSSCQAILLLGSSTAYISRVKETIRRLHPVGFRDLNDVAYEACGVRWIHLAHPSKGNGHLSAWLGADSTNPSGRKRDLAIKTIQQFGLADDG